MMKGRNDEARATLARLHAHGNENDIFVLSEYADIHDSVEKEKLETRDAWVQLFSNKANFRRVVSWKCLERIGLLRERFSPFRPR